MTCVDCIWWLCPPSLHPPQPPPPPPPPGCDDIWRFPHTKIPVHHRAEKGTARMSKLILLYWIRMIATKIVITWVLICIQYMYWTPGTYPESAARREEKRTRVRMCVRMCVCLCCGCVWMCVCVCTIPPLDFMDHACGLGNALCCLYPSPSTHTSQLGQSWSF